MKTEQSINMKKAAKRILSFFLILIFMTAIAACKRTEANRDPADPNEGMGTHIPVESADPSDAHFVYISNSQYTELSVFSRMALSGSSPDGRLVLERSRSRVFFDYTDSGFAAFAKARIGKEAFDSPFISSYECLEPLAVFPGELGDMAWERISSLYAEKTGTQADKTVPLEGWFGDDYAVFVYAPGGFEASPQVHCIFRSDDDGWHEFGNYPDLDFPLNGAFILSDRVGFVCVGAWKGAVTMDESNCRRVFVFMTEDGGTTWRDLGLELPEYYDMSENYAFSPFFEGDHGIIPVQNRKYNYGPNDPVPPSEAYRLVWFETNDGGMTWVFTGPVE